MDGATPPKVMMDIAQSLGTPGFRLVDAGELYALLSSIFSTQAGIAATGTTQATGFKLKAAINTVTSASAGNLGVVLPPGIPGKEVTIANGGTVAINVFASGADQMIPVASSTPGASIAQAQGTTGVYLCISRTLVSPIVATWKQVSVA